MQNKRAYCKTRTGFVKDGFVKHGFVKRGFVKHGFVKHGFVKGGLSFFVKMIALVDCLFVYFCLSLFNFNSFTLYYFHFMLPLHIRHIVKHRLDWICKTRTGFVKHGFVKHGFVIRGFVKHGFVKRRFVKRGFVKHGFVKRGFVKHGFVKHGFVKGGLSFFVKMIALFDCLFVYFCPFLILILLLYIIFILGYRSTFK